MLNIGLPPQRSPFRVNSHWLTVLLALFVFAVLPGAPAAYASTGFSKLSIPSTAFEIQSIYPSPKAAANGVVVALAKNSDTGGYSILYSADSGQNWRKAQLQKDKTWVQEAPLLENLKCTSSGGFMITAKFGAKTTTLVSADGYAWYVGKGAALAASSGYWTFTQTNSVFPRRTRIQTAGKLSLYLQGSNLKLSKDKGKTWTNQVAMDVMDYLILDSNTVLALITDGNLRIIKLDTSAQKNIPEVKLFEIYKQDKTDPNSKWIAPRLQLATESNGRPVILAYDATKPGNLILSFDSGITWRQINPDKFALSPTEAPCRIAAVSYLTGGWIAAATVDGNLLLSRDYGQTWTGTDIGILCTDLFQIRLKDSFLFVAKGLVPGQGNAAADKIRIVRFSLRS
ncbi:MAG: hypothetical protein ACM3QZ_10990 [Solirubrobacterales bacterium]